MNLRKDHYWFMVKTHTHLWVCVLTQTYPYLSFVERFHCPLSSFDIKSCELVLLTTPGTSNGNHVCLSTHLALVLCVSSLVDHTHTVLGQWVQRDGSQANSQDSTVQYTHRCLVSDSVGSLCILMVSRSRYLCTQVCVYVDAVCQSLCGDCC